MRKIILILLFFSLFQSFAFAQNLIEATLKDGIGIRALGMGGAFTAVADDGSALFYNPAGLGDLGFGYYSGDLDLNRELSDLSTYNIFSFGEMGLYTRQLRSADEGVNVTSFGYGRRVGGGFSWGLAYKTISWSLLSGDSQAWTSDVGAILRLTPEITFGILGQDFAEDKTLDVPPTTRIGVALRPFEKWFTLALDGETGRSGVDGMLTHWGAEARVMEGFRLRAGSDAGAFTAGATFNLPVFTLDYAYLSDSRIEKTLHRFGASIAFFKEWERPFSLIRPKEYALIDIRGRVIGGKDRFSILGGISSGSDSIIAQIRRATEDVAIDGIMLRIGGFEGGIGSMGIVQELRSELERSKKKGKKVVAYIETSALGDEYYLASVADKIVAPKGASIGGLGRSIAVSKAKKLMDKIGINMQVMAKGKYKAAFDVFSDELSPEQRSMIESIVAERYRQMLTDIAKSRDMDIEKLKDIGDGKIFTAVEAKDLGLVDEIGYFKDAAELGAKMVGGDGEAKMIGKRLLLEEWESEYMGTQLSKIAVIEVEGTIVTGGSGDNILFGGRVTGADTVTDQIKKATDDMWVKAIVLRVNSPGGSVVGAGQIYQELWKAKEKGKIVVASMGDVAASGGYFISSAADVIVADPGTVTGSIGVIGSIPELSELFKKLGVETEVIKEGKHSDMFSGLRKLTPEERESLEELMTEAYNEFISAVSKGREMSTEEVEAIAEGRIYTGNQAFELNLVDELGGFSDAIDIAKDLAEIRGQPRIIYYGRRIPFGGVGFLTEVLGNSGWPFGEPKNFELGEYRLSF